MTDTLDLALTLSPPPADAPPETLATIGLRYGALDTGHSGNLLHDPLSAAERTDLNWYLEEYWQWPYEQFAARAQRIEHMLEVIGRRLYDAIAGSVDAVRVIEAWRRKPDAERRISISSGIPTALSLPWELLHDGQGFLVLQTRHPISLVRSLPQHEAAPEQASFTPPLRVLLVTARPDDAGFIDPRGIARELLDEVQTDTGAIAVELLRPPTLPALRARLSDTTQPPIHILHFDGHGVFQPDKEATPLPADGVRLRGGGIGVLAFEHDDGTLDRVPAAMLAQVLNGAGVRLAVLTACQSALGAADDAFSSVAGRLIGGGVDAVVAMSASLLVASAARYVEAFYRHLAAGEAVPLAHERARQALHDDPRRHVIRRRSDEAGAPVELQDWWLPHFYQQRPLILQPKKPKRRRPTTDDQSPQEREAERLAGFPPPPRYQWVGRARELLALERALRRGQLVVVQGFGGLGKTALSRESADWLTRTGMYAKALFVSFESGGDATSLLSTLGQHLGVYDGGYRPDDPQSALRAVAPALARRPTLLVADNLEALLPGGDAALPADERTKLWNVLLQLAALTRPSAHLVTSSPLHSCGVILTTRDTNFGDAQLRPGPETFQLVLGGLTPDDAYALATGLLDAAQIGRARVPYSELHALLNQLGYHPLAIQLVLPALGNLSLAQVRDDFAALLPRFADDAMTGRNASLLASLDYSLRRLSDTQRAWLPRLALFESGASEDDLLAITEIPEAEWATLRPALEQAALIRAEKVHEAIPAPFLHFHPVLAPFLRAQLGANDAILRDRYADRYAALANYLYHEDDRKPQPVRALVQRELPNLRRALDLLIARGDADAVATMAENVSKFLNFFGRRRELEELRRKVEQVAASSSATGSALTQAEFLRESGLGEDEYQRRDLRAAYTRFTVLLQRIEAAPQNTARGCNSYEHCLILGWLARCLAAGGQPAAAEKALLNALAIIEALIAQQPENQGYLRMQGFLYADLGDVLRDQGNYAQARIAYEEARRIAQQQGDLRSQGVVLGQLGLLALQQRDYAEAKQRYNEALKLFRALNEPASEATVWHQLGIVAEQQRQWSEAERCYRESLALKEQHSSAADVATTCNQLANVAQCAGRPTEAEGWYKRALKYFDILEHQGAQAKVLNNLAALLFDEVQAGRAPREWLAEVREYAERALAIKETLDIGSGTPWNSLSILASIADAEGRAEDARVYRRHERDAFAAFAGNRWHIDQQHGELIAAIAPQRRATQRRRRRSSKPCRSLRRTAGASTTPRAACGTASATGTRCARTWIRKTRC